MTQRKTTGAAPAAKRTKVNDGLQNFQAHLGLDTGNLMDGSVYNLTNPITRQPRQLEFMYRGSWIVRTAVDAIADDMTREGVDFGSALPPDINETLKGQLVDTQTWQGIGDVIRWSRLYGGAIGVIMIDGQDVASPLRPQTVTQGAFKGVLPLSRWELLPTVEQMIDNLGPGLGNPEVYKVGPMALGLQGQTIHHSRVIRMEGVRLPYYQRVAEQGWGLTIVEPMFDRLLAFDSASTGAAQLIFKAYLRTLKVDGLRKILAAGGDAEKALLKNVDFIRRFQSSEGLTLVDGEDDFQTHSYTFAGLDDVLLQFGQQLAGATEIPLVRLFGQSPAGLNSTGESDTRNYYDSIKAKQESKLRAPVSKVLDIAYRSATGEAPPSGFNYTFNALWQMSEKDKSDIAKSVAESVGGMYDAGIIDRPTALRELKQSSEVTGIFSNITEEQIAEAENEPPEPGEAPNLSGLSVGSGLDALSPPAP